MTMQTKATKPQVSEAAKRQEQLAVNALALLFKSNKSVSTTPFQFRVA